MLLKVSPCGEAKRAALEAEIQQARTELFNRAHFRIELVFGMSKQYMPFRLQPVKNYCLPHPGAKC